jgi:RNA polymerase sigma factor for flagellar operon FliA
MDACSMKLIGKLTDAELDEAWHSYKETGKEQYRQQLILHYQPLVQSVAKRVGVRLPSHIDDEDLASYGNFGLMDAIEKFDLDRGIKFATYASQRIKGAIIDELRSIDWVPRSVRSQVREVDRTFQELEAQLLRPPTENEVADVLGISLTELQKNKGQQNFIHVVALDALVAPDSDSDSFSLINQLHDNRTQSPDLAYEAEEVKELLAVAVATLPEREAIVLVLYYYEGLTLAEIGQALNVTESRVCQMHTRAMSQVRGRLAVA